MVYLPFSSNKVRSAELFISFKNYCCPINFFRHSKNLAEFLSWNPAIFISFVVTTSKKETCFLIKGISRRTMYRESSGWHRHGWFGLPSRWRYGPAWCSPPPIVRWDRGDRVPGCARPPYAGMPCKHSSAWKAPSYSKYPSRVASKLSYNKDKENCYECKNR